MNTESSPQKRNILLKEIEWSIGGIFLGLFVFFLFLSVLNYFNILTLSSVFPQLSFLPHQPYSQTATVQNSAPKPKRKKPVRLVLNCPVEEQFCKEAQKTTFQSDPALAYKLTSGSGVLTTTEIPTEEHMELFENLLLNTKTLYVSTQTSDDNCYTITYTVPANANFLQPETFPVQKGTPIFRIQDTKIGSHEASLLLMVRKILKPTVTCVIRGNEQKEAGPYQPFDTITVL